jgi:hypothetical protein
MSGPGLGLLHKVLIDKSTPSILADFEIEYNDFIADERTVYDCIFRHYEVHGAVPAVRTVEVETKVRLRAFPDEPLSYWVEKVKERNKRKLLLEYADNIRERAREDKLEEAEQAAQELLFELEMRSPTDRIHKIGAVAENVLKNHDRRKLSVGISGVPFGLPYIDEVSDGAQPTDTIAVVGRPSVGKTYFMLRLALNAWEQKRIPLFLSMEMPPLQVVRRLLALRTNLPVSGIRKGRISGFGRKQMVEEINKFAELDKATPFLVMQGSLTSTVEDLVLQVQEYKPSALYVDGAYMLRSRTKTQQRWERVTETAEILKRIATEFSIPVISSYQFNRRGPGSLGNIAFSDAVGQLASIVISISDEPDSETGVVRNEAGAVLIHRQYKIVELIKGREGEKGKIRVVYDMFRMKIEQDSILRSYTGG